jgi:CheY-like chemotaxis protein
MVYGFIKQSGGHIEVESEVGRGATFRIYLPRTDDSAPSGRSCPEAVALPRGTETILVVEDQDAVRAFARHVLQTAGYTVLEARDGEDGLRAARQCQGPIHLVVTDVVMPRMGGPQLAELLARERPGLRVLFVSGYAGDAITSRGAPGVGSAFLGKPFDPVRFARRVRELLDAGPADRG